MSCKAVRRELSQHSSMSPDVVRHLGRCADCNRLAQSYAQIRSALRERHAGALPDGHFAPRVGAQLREQPRAELLGWAAVRLLPITLGLALMLGWFAWQSGPLALTLEGESTVVSTEDPIEWLLADEESSFR